MNRWYRAYEGTVSDPKLGEVALVAEASRSVVIATWHAILESAASTQDGGRFDTTPRRVAALLGEPIALVTAVFAAIEETGLTGNGVVTAWNRRQFESDSSTARTRAWREKKKANGVGGDDGDGGGTSPRRHRTPPETEAETETEEAATAASASAGARGSASKEHFDHVEARCRDALGRLAPIDLVIGPVVKLAEDRDFDGAVLPALIDAARSSRSPIRTWRLLAERALERLNAPPLTPISTLNGAGHGPHRKPSTSDVLRARLAELERDDDRPGPLLRIAGH